MIQQNRLAEFDILKGIAIYLVVMGHILTMCIRGIDACITFKIVEQIHMPIFFFISGWFSYKSTSNGPASPNLSKRFKQLIIPFLVVSAIWITYFPHSGLKSPLSSSIPQMLTTYWKDGYWFTLSLFEIICLYWIITKLTRKSKSTITTIAISLAIYITLILITPIISDTNNNYDPIGIGLLTRFFPIFIFGAICRKHQEKFKQLATDSSIFIAALAIGALAWYYASYIWEFPNIPAWAAYIIFPALHICLLTVIFGIIYKIKRNPATEGKPSIIQRYFIYLGNESLGIYLLHYFFLFPLTPLQEPLRAIGLAFTPTATIAATGAFIVIGLTLGANYIISKNKILSFLLLGKEVKN